MGDRPQLSEGYVIIDVIDGQELRVSMNTLLRSAWRFPDGRVRFPPLHLIIY